MTTESLTPYEKVQLRLLAHIASSLNYLLDKPPYHLENEEFHEEQLQAHTRILNSTLDEVRAVLGSEDTHQAG